MVYSVKGQNFCFTPPTSSNLSINSSAQMRSLNNNSYCLKIYFHVIRRSNGTGGQAYADVKKAYEVLNQDFNPHNIFFNWDNQIDYIDNNTFFTNPTTAIFNINNHQNGIDIYLFDDSATAGGRANGVGESSEFWISGSYWKSPYNSLTTSHVISHEMGHVLFLWHTHHGTYPEGGNDNPCPELVNGTNSNICGDYVEDTPADPHLHFDVNQSTCQWNDTAKDVNGDLYNPDEKLIMSYTDVGCMQYFSPKQGERMRNAIATLPYLQQVVSSNCTVKLSGPKKVCYNNSGTFNLINGYSPVSWQTSSNLQILSSNNLSITIKPINPTVNGQGYVRAILSNKSIQQNVVVGAEKPYGFVTVVVDPYIGRIKATVEPVPHATGYEWYIDGVQYTGSGMNRAYVTIPIPKNNCAFPYYRIGVKAITPCGTSDIYFESYDNPCYGSSYYTYSPNPASEKLTIKRVILKNSKSASQYGISSTLHRYKLHDFKGNLIFEGSLSKITTIDVSRLPKGRYILSIQIDTDKKETHQIIIH